MGTGTKGYATERFLDYLEGTVIKGEKE